jgi:hypothetical protein
VGRIRELLAHGGIALLAVVFALAFTAVELAGALSQVIVAAIQQHTADPDSGTSGFSFRLLGTEIETFYVAQSALALVFIVAVLLGIWRLGRSTLQECPECHSQVPRDARICRFCTTDLPRTAEG